MQNRTAEFFGAVESLQARGSGAMHASHLMNRLHSTTTPSLATATTTTTTDQQQKQKLLSTGNKTEFTVRSNQLVHAISQTFVKLEKLSKLAKKKSLFDDRPLEIQELTLAVKDDISRLNSAIGQLDQSIKQQQQQHKSYSGDNSTHQMLEHSSNIVVALQSKLAALSNEFKDVLEMRSQNIRAQNERRNQFTASTSSGLMHRSNALSSTSNNPLYAPDRSTTTSQDANNNNETAGGFVSISMPLQQQQQLQALQTDQTDSYLSGRVEAIEGIEKTITDLATLFNQLTSMISAHDDLVRRIDYNVEQVDTNVQGAQQQLFRYMNSISSNRWLMTRIFAILIFFFLIFVLFFA